MMSMWQSRGEGRKRHSGASDDGGKINDEKNEL
jgi:hypothetical protein